MWNRFKSHFTMVEFVSFLQTFFAVLAVDAVTQAQVIFEGNFSHAALLALLTAFLRSLWKAFVLVVQKDASSPKDPSQS